MQSHCAHHMNTVTSATIKASTPRALSAAQEATVTHMQSFIVRKLRAKTDIQQFLLSP